MKRATSILFMLLLTLTTAGTALAWGGSAQVRVLHASPDAPPVNVLIDGRIMFPHVNYGQTTRYARLEPGSYNIKVVSADRDQVVVIDTNLNVDEGQAYTVAAVGYLPTIEPLVLVDTTDPPGWGQAKVRVVHASPNAPAVDVVTSQGNVLFTEVAFKGITDYQSVERGLYHLQVKPAGVATAVLDIPWLPLHPGSVQTIVVLGLVNDHPELMFTSLIHPVFSAGGPCNPCRQPQQPRPNSCCEGYLPPPRPSHPAAYQPWPYHPQDYPNAQFWSLPYQAYYQSQFHHYGPW